MTSLGGYVDSAGDMAPLCGRDGLRSVMFVSPDSNITDETLASLLPHLESLPDLKSLSLGDQPISDRSIDGLKGLSQLEFLDLSGTDLTETGINDLRRDLPACQIWSDFAAPVQR